MKLIKGFLFTILFLVFFTCKGGTWFQRDSLTGARNLSVGFSIGNKGYIGTGVNGSGTGYYYKDFWEWNPDSNVWTQKADFAGGYRAGAVGFSIGSKGYIGTGANVSGYHNDFWEYNPDSNIWIKKANFTGTARWIAVGFSIGSKGYIGTGNINSSSSGFVKDFWEWDGDTGSINYNTWAQKADFGGVSRQVAIAFSTDSNGYIGTGTDAFYLYSDFWQWNQASNTWVQKADFGGGIRQGAAAFSIGQKGYVGTGDNGVNKKDFWEYNPPTDTWTQLIDFGGAARWNATGFSIGNKGYIGMGFFFSVSTNDFWEYCDTCSVGIEEINNTLNIDVFPNPATDKIFITAKNNIAPHIKMFNSIGKQVLEKDFNNGCVFEIGVINYAKGIYFLKLYTEQNTFTQKIIIE